MVNLHRILNNKWFIYILLTSVFILLTAPLTGCANYQFGSISKAYCGTASPEMRAQIRATAEKGGIVFDIDYCASVGLIDAMITRVD